MRGELYRIQTKYGRLAIMPRPRAGDWLGDEMKQLRAAGVDFVISLLTPEEISELGLANEPQACHDAGIGYVSFPIADREVPASQEATIELIAKIEDWLKQNRSVAIHCRMGIGRSALIAACALVRQGYEPNVAFEIIGEARRTQVPDTVAQTDWVSNLAASLRASE